MKRKKSGGFRHMARRRMLFMRTVVVSIFALVFMMLCFAVVSCTKLDSTAESGMSYELPKTEQASPVVGVVGAGVLVLSGILYGFMGRKKKR